MVHGRLIFAATLTAIALTANLSFAQESDTIGIYFDAAGSQTSLDTAVPFAVVPVYLIVRNPSHPDGLGSWECVIEVATDGPEPLTNWAINGQGINVFTPPSFAVGLASPLPSDQDVLLATGQIIVPESGQKISLFVHHQNPPSLKEPPEFGYPVYAPLYGHGPANDFQPLVQSSGCGGLPVAEINPDGNPAAPVLSAPSSLNLGQAGQTTPHTATITNTSNLTATGTLTIEGDGYSYLHGNIFYTTDPTTFSIRPGAALTVTVNFAETGLQDNPGRLMLETCGALTIIELTTETPFPVCVVSPTALDIGPVPLGSQGFGQFRISNPGDADLFVDVQSDNPDFWLPGGGPRLVVAGGFEDLDVIFYPKAIGPAQATVTFGDDWGCDALLLTGAGVDSPPACLLSSTQLDFGEILVGASGGFSFLIVNNGGGVLVGDVSLAPGSEGFSIASGAGPFALGPFEEKAVVVFFAPTAGGPHLGTVQTGTACSDVLLLGTGLAPVPDCTLAPPDLAFGNVQLGTGRTLYTKVTNNGNVAFTLDPSIDSGPFFIATSGFPVNMPPGAVRYVYVVYTPTAIGTDLATMQTGIPDCPEIPLSGNGVANTQNLDRLGVYFDEQYEVNYIDLVPTGIQPAYVVLKQSSGGGGVAAWRAGLLALGSNAVTNWTPAGDVLSNGGYASCFDVTLATPLPPAAEILLLTFDILVVDQWSETDIYLSTDCFNPPVYFAADDPATPITMRSATDSAWLAGLNNSPLPVELPSPLSRTAGDEIVLTWNYLGAEADGFHVWRRHEGGGSVRLTASPLTSPDGRFTYTDQPALFGAAVLHYSCAAVRDGIEIARGPETAVAYAGRPLPLTTVLLPNYPNPFNPTTTIPFEMSRPGRARVAIFDLAGRQVVVLADQDYGAGYHEEIWAGTDSAGRRVPSGSYYARLKTEEGVRMQKMMLLK
jgi:hypothetical protein